MKRRHFFRHAACAVGVMPTLLADGCRCRSVSNPDAGDSASSVHSFELDEISIMQLREDLSHGRYSSRALVEKYLKRIQEIDAGGVRLNSVIELNPDALSLADEADKLRQDGTIRGPLHGIPFLLKDNIDTGDKMMTTAGSLANVRSPCNFRRAGRTAAA